MSNQYKKEFRCTRNELYSDPECLGHRNLSARQGHYIHADTEEEALAIMRANFPSETFTVQEWNCPGNVTIEKVVDLKTMADLLASEAEIKRVQHVNLDEVIDNAKPLIHKMLNDAWYSDELTLRLRKPNFILAKLVLTAWGESDPFNVNNLNKKELQNLKKFI